jgi:hypothetical protein
MMLQSVQLLQTMSTASSTSIFNIVERLRTREDLPLNREISYL